MQFNESMSYGDLVTEMTRILENRAKQIVELPPGVEFMNLGTKIRKIIREFHFKSYEIEAYNYWSDIRNDYMHEEIDRFDRDKLIYNFNIVEKALTRIIFQKDSLFIYKNKRKSKKGEISIKIVEEIASGKFHVVQENHTYEIVIGVIIIFVGFLFALWFIEHPGVTPPPKEPQKFTGTTTTIPPVDRGTETSSQDYLALARQYENSNLYLSDSFFLLSANMGDVDALAWKRNKAAYFYSQAIAYNNSNGLQMVKSIRMGALMGDADCISWCKEHGLDYSQLSSLISDDALLSQYGSLHFKEDIAKANVDTPALHIRVVEGKPAVPISEEPQYIRPEVVQPVSTTSGQYVSKPGDLSYPPSNQTNDGKPHNCLSCPP